MDEIVHVLVPQIVCSVMRDTCHMRVGLEQVGVQAHMVSTKVIAKLMMNDLDVGEALGNGSRTGW